MTIVQLVESIVTAMGGSPPLTFVHGSKAWQNYFADRKSIFPIAFLDEPITSKNLLTKTSWVEERYTLSLMFANKSGGLDRTPAQLQVIIAAMRVYAAEFIQRLSDNDNVKLVLPDHEIDDISYFTSANLTGCVLTFTVIPKNLTSICY